MLQYLFPLPNYGPAGATSNNLAATFATPIDSAQTDIRIDQQINSKQSVNFHATYKNRRVDAPSNGSASLGSFSEPEIDYALIGGYTYVISPTVVNELKGGIAGNHYSLGFGVTAAQIASELGLGAGFSIPAGDAVPGVYISGFQHTEQFFGTYSSDSLNAEAIQLLDTLTWTKGKHNDEVRWRLPLFERIPTSGTHTAQTPPRHLQLRRLRHEFASHRRCHHGIRAHGIFPAWLSGLDPDFHHPSAE